MGISNEDYDHIYSGGAHKMRQWAREMLDRFSRQAQERGNHVEAQHYAYAASKVAELPTDRASLERVP